MELSVVWLLKIPVQDSPGRSMSMIWLGLTFLASARGRIIIKIQTNQNRDPMITIKEYHGRLIIIMGNPGLNKMLL